MKWNEDNPAVRAGRKIHRRLKEAGCEAYWVGGCVRDAILGIDPADIDITTSATPEEVQRQFPRTVAVGAQFGVILVIEEGVETEVATFRTEDDYLDSRHPSTVRYGTAREDVLRRDFTINALLYEPEEDRTIDYVGGCEDLRNGLLRAIGDPYARFQEDALRLLRAIRFAVRFDLAIEEETRDSLDQNAFRIICVSPERIRDELARILTGPNPARALTLLDETGLLERILPEVGAMNGVPQPEKFHPEGDVFEHTRLALEHMPERPSAPLAFATLLHDVGKPPTIKHSDRIRFNEHDEVGAQIADQICRRLRFSNQTRKRVVELIANHMRFMNVHKMKKSTLRQFLAMEHFDEHLALHRADCLASHGKLDNYEYCLEKLEEFQQEAKQPVLPPPLINGHDLIRAGYRPGPGMGEMLAAAREAQLEGELETAKQAMEWVRERFSTEAEQETDKEAGS